MDQQAKCFMDLLKVKCPELGLNAWIEQLYRTYASLRKTPLTPLYIFPIVLKSRWTTVFMTGMMGRHRHSDSTRKLLMQGATAQMCQNDRQANSEPQSSDKGTSKMALRVR